MKTVSTVIFLSPGTELIPITSPKYPKFELPLLNEPLFLHNLRWVRDISQQIFIIYLQKYGEKVKNILKDFDFDGQIILKEKEQFDGTVYNLKKILKEINSANILITKGDIITSIKLEYIFDLFFKEKTNVFTILKKEPSKSSIVGFNDDRMSFYTDDFNNTLPYQLYTATKQKTLTKGIDLAQVYIFRKKYFARIEGDYFSLKSNLIPTIVNGEDQNPPIRFFLPENDFFQIQKFQDFWDATVFLRERIKNLPFYLHISEIEENDYELKKIQIHNYNIQNKNFSYKNKQRVSFTSDKNIVGQFLQIGKATLKKTVIGNNCKIGNNVYLDECIILDNVILSDNCRLQRTFIGNNVTLPSNTILVDCKVMNDFNTHKKLQATNKTFLINKKTLAYDEDEMRENTQTNDKKNNI